MTKQTKILLLLALATSEIACLFLSVYTVSVATILYTLAGIAIAIIPLLNVRKEPIVISAASYRRYTYLLYIALVLLICNWISNVFRSHIADTPLDSQSDMMLYLRVMAQRYLAHQHVYDPLPTVFGIPIQAVYLPGFWLPYCLPLYWGYDIRWMSMLSLAATVFVSAFVRRSRFSDRYFLLLIPIALFIYLILGGAAFYLMFTQEAIMLFYVALLTWALLYEHWRVAGIAAACCIMSRYFLGAPLLCGIIWLFATDLRAALRTTLAFFTTLVLILTISRSWGDIVHFIRIPFLYVDLLNNDTSFEAFRHIYYHSVGFASFFHADTVHLISTLNIAILILVPMLYFICAYRYLSQCSKGIIIICGIKIFLVLFLTTLSRPFGYVLYTSSLISIMLLRGSIALFSEGPDGL